MKKQQLITAYNDDSSSTINNNNEVKSKINFGYLFNQSPKASHRFFVPPKKLDRKTKIQICWESVLNALKEKDILNAIFCCMEGYRLSYPTIHPDKIANNKIINANLNELIESYRNNNPIWHIEFARLEQMLIMSLAVREDAKALHKLAELGNESVYFLYFLNLNRVQLINSINTISKEQENLNVNLNNNTLIILKTLLKLKQINTDFNLILKDVDKLATPSNKMLLRMLILCHLLEYETYNEPPYLDFVIDMLKTLMQNLNLPYYYYQAVTRFHSDLLQEIKDIFVDSASLNKFYKLAICSGDVYFFERVLISWNSCKIIGSIPEYLSQLLRKLDDSQRSTTLGEMIEDCNWQKALQQISATSNPSKKLLTMQGLITVLTYQTEAIALLEVPEPKQKSHSISRFFLRGRLISVCGLSNSEAENLAEESFEEEYSEEESSGNECSESEYSESASSSDAEQSNMKRQKL